MESGASAADLVAHVDPKVDGITGLITVTTREERIVALVTSRSKLPEVRRQLIGLGVPDEVLELHVIEDALIPYPVTDDRLRRWLEEAEEAGAVDAAVTVKGPSLSMTPRRVGKAVLFLVVGWFVLSTLLFMVLMIYEWWAAS